MRAPVDDPYLPAATVVGVIGEPGCTLRLGWVAALEGRSDTGSVRQIGQLKF